MKSLRMLGMGLIAAVLFLSLLSLKGVGQEPPRKNPPPQGRSEGKTSFGLKPLTEMTAEDKYKGEDGGLYGGGYNEPPPEHQAAVRKELAKIVPLDAEGNQSKDGKIILLSLGGRHPTEDFSSFKKTVDADPEKSPSVVIMDGALGGQGPPKDGRNPLEQRLYKEGATVKQVQVAMMKQSFMSPKNDFPAHAQKLRDDLIVDLNNYKEKYPNLRVIYMTTRYYGGYGDSVNPEPQTFEAAFAIRWLIQDQIKGEPKLNYDPAKGEVHAPLILWGPYYWADGTTPRKSDGLIWERNDYENDGTHLSRSGTQKVIEMLLKFFRTDAGARTWLLKG